ncbi:hypothetical protein ABZ413_27530 [Nocardia rhamnosiphila]|uniref:WXG100-like domain-containing protein n=1 Tax=Nocardia rhamnosiphila TaxID=426716 RepID=UPI00341028A6
MHIPSEVVFFLNALGIPYPDIDVDQIREMAQAIDEFAVDVRKTFEDSTATLEEMESVLSGDSYQSILVLWSHTTGKMAELETAFDVASTALDIAADVIEAIQIVVLVELAALAASFIASMFTPAGPATGPLLAAAARQITKALAEFLMWYIAGELMAKAFEPMLDKFDEFVRDALRPPDVALPTPGSSSKVHMDPEGVDRAIRVLESHARDMEEHGEKLGNRLSELDFNTPGLDVPTDELPGPATVSPPVNINQPNPLTTMFPDLLPGPQQQPDVARQPTVESPTGGAAAGESGAAAPGDPRTNGDTPPQVESSSGADMGRPAATAPPEAVPSSAPGSASLPAGVSAGGSDPSGQAGITADTRSIAPDNASSGADTAGTAPAHHAVGMSAGTVPQATAQSTSSAAGTQSAGGSSQTGAGSNAQRPTDAAAGKAQSGAGRGAGGQGGTGASGGSDSRPSDKKVARTPWSRAGGKAGRVTPATKHPDQKVPAVSAGESGTSGEDARTQATPDNSRAAGPQVFAPSTEAPPPETPDDKSTADDRDRDVPVAAPTKEVDSSGVGTRPPASGSA